MIGVHPGMEVEIRSAHGSVRAIVEADDSLRRGVVSISHCWGGLPDLGSDLRLSGTSTNRLISSKTNIEPINAMPWMSAVSVKIFAITKGETSNP
jgi:anaerobic selenocysteine-containing dehydrogenase